MKYYLAVNHKDYKTNQEEFFKVNFGNCTELQDIIDFTTTFYDEEFMKSYLLSEKLLPRELGKEAIKIISVDSKNNVNVLKYGIPYCEDISFYSINNIIFYLKDNIKNKKLLERFYYNFAPNYDKVKKGLYADLFFQLRNYIKNIDYYDSFDNFDIEDTITNIVKLIGTNNKGKDVLGVHRMAMVLINYQRKTEKDKIKEQLENDKAYLEHVQHLINNKDLLPDELEVLLQKEYELMVKTNSMEIDSDDCPKP